MKHILKTVVVMGVLWAGIALNSIAAAQDIYFAGFSLIGDYANNETRYPVASRLMAETATTAEKNLNRALHRQLKQLQRQDLNIRYDLAVAGSGNELALAFAVSEENLEEIKAEGGYYSFYQVTAQILVFDFNENKTIANFPVTVKHQDFTEGQQKSRAAHDRVFERIYLDDNFDVMIFRQWVKKLDIITLKPKYRGYLQLRNVAFAEGVQASMPEIEGNPTLYRNQVAQQFEAALTTAHNVPLIPYTKGQAVGKNMVARFANGTRLQLTLPEPDYVIDVTLRPFKHKKIVKGNKEQHAFGAFITMVLSQPDSGQIYLDSKFKNINFVVKSTLDHVNLDKAQAYQNSLKSLFAKFSKFTAAEDISGLKKMTKSNDIKQQLLNFNKVIAKCS